MKGKEFCFVCTWSGREPSSEVQKPHILQLPGEFPVPHLIRLGTGLPHVCVMYDIITL